MLGWTSAWIQAGILMVAIAFGKKWPNWLFHARMTVRLVCLDESGGQLSSCLKDRPEVGGGGILHLMQLASCLLEAGKEFEM